MPINLPSFEEITIKNGWKDAKIVLQQKRMGNIWKIDLRIWARKEGSDEFYPTKKGICLTNDDIVNHIIPELQKLTDKYI